MKKAIIELEKVSIGFGPKENRTEVLKDVDLKVMKNEFVAIIGFSGSGKSTLISLLGGLLNPDSGYVFFKGREAGDPGPDRGIMFQNYSLLPWLSVFGNIALAVKQVFPQYSKEQCRTHTERYIEMVNLTPATDKKPHELSGGMRQRVSLARTLSMQPDVMLLDEPLSALDALTRANLQDEIVRIWEEDKKTVIMITNDVDEAVLMADRIIPLSVGPKATLEGEFAVPLRRPRDRTTLNHNAAFKSLRNTVTQQLIQMNQEAKNLRINNTIEMPSVQPLDFTAA